MEVHVMNDMEARDLDARDLETTLRTLGQRRINLIWEVTQSIIALATVGGGVWIMVHDSLVGGPRSQIPTTLSSMIFLVLGFYFARTNHSATGGVGPTHHPDQKR
jgi:hypothetical protein